MTGISNSVVLSQTPDGKVAVTIRGLHVMQGSTEIPVATLTPGKEAQTTTVAIDASALASLGPSVDAVVFWALLILLILTTVLGTTLVAGMIWNLTKTMDKFAQLLSEEGSQKMSFSRVQALIFRFFAVWNGLKRCQAGSSRSSLPASR